jgi:hypothetical protein
MTHLKLKTLKLETVRAILMQASAFGEVTCATSNRSSNDHLSSPSMFSRGRIGVGCLLFLISFFVKDQTMTCSTFALKKKTSCQLK